MLKGYRVRDYDFKLILMMLALSIIGVLAVGSAKEDLQSKQLAGVIGSLFLMLVISFFDYSIILKLYWLMYIGNLVLLSLVAYAGTRIGGAQRWLQIGTFRFQPSETVKIILILFFAQFIMKHKEEFNTFKIISSCIVLVALPIILMYQQPDLSTSIVVAAIFCVVMFAGGLKYKVVIGVLAVAIPAVAILISLALQPGNEILDTYQKNRILAFVNPEEYSTAEAYQQLNARTAIASGQLDGKGYKNNEITSVKNGNFISEPETDFIFAIIGEEFGFKGAVTVIVLLIAISLECISVARKSKDLAGTVIAAGMGGLVAIQSFINIGVNTFILPNTGLPLPFVSSGLTSLVSLYIGMGFVLNIRLQAKRQ